MHVFRVAEEPPDFRPGIEDFFVGRKRPVVINSRDFLAEITGRDGPGAGTFVCPSWIETGGERRPPGVAFSQGLGALPGGGGAVPLGGGQSAGGEWRVD